MASWFALRVRSRCEKVVASIAHEKGYETFLPLYQCRHRWSDRLKVVDLPLFPGYLFCRLEAQHRLPLLSIHGVLHLVGVGKTPVPIDDAEVASIQTAIRSELALEPWPFVELGQRVRLCSGPLAGMEGYLVETPKQNRVVVSLTALKKSIAMDIQQDWLTSQKPARDESEDDIARATAVGAERARQLAASAIHQPRGAKIAIPLQ